MEIRVYKAKVPREELIYLAKASYGDMVKGVVDIRREALALGGDLHADAEQALLDQGSLQEDVWGFNIYIDRPKEIRLQYASMINIRPRQDNRGMEVQDAKLRAKMKDIIDRWIE